MKRLCVYLLLCLVVMGCSPDTPTEPCKDEAQLAIQLAQLVEDESFEDALSILDRIIVKDDNLIKIVPYYDKNTIDYHGDISPIVIYNQQGEWLSTNFQEDFWTYLQVEESQMGAWQAYLMSQMWHYLPLWWHSNYERRSYVYSKSSKIELEGDLDDEEYSFNQAITTNDVTPSIKQEGDEFFISACYWTIHGGLYREKCVVKFDGDKVTIKNIDSDVLFEYHCGILY